MRFKCFLNVLLFLVCYGKLFAFEVKVLLQKRQISEYQKSPIELSSDFGFLISSQGKVAVGSECKAPVLNVKSTHDQLYINGKPLYDKILYIVPMLSHAHQAQLKSIVMCWLESCREDVYSLAQNLHSLFDEMVSSDEPLKFNEYDLLTTFGVDVGNLFILDTIENLLEESLYSLPVLQANFAEILGRKTQERFIAHLSEKHLTSEYRKVLQKDSKKRYQFFQQQLMDVLGKLLVESVYQLPRNFLQQVLQEPTSMIEFEGNKYFGSFILYQEKKQLFIINCLDIDDYLLSVVRHEGFPGWPLEMNKVLAIACRTYLVYQVLQAQKLNRPYHIENGIKHQTYKGYHDSPKLKQAVYETKDMIVGYDGYPACTMYDSCCGGIVPGSIDDPGYQRIPYLARMYPCTFCKGCKSYTWSVDFSLDVIQKRLCKDFPKIDKITDIRVSKKDKAGLAKKIQITAGNRKIVITEKKMKSLFPELRSYCFDITKAHKRFIVDGKGFGHHKGLCQWGAFHLVKHEHWNFIEVLQFYYPGTTLMKLSYQR